MAQDPSAPAAGYRIPAALDPSNGPEDAPSPNTEGPPVAKRLSRQEKERKLQMMYFEREELDANIRAVETELYGDS